MGRPSAREMTIETNPVFSATYTQAPSTIIAAIEFNPSSAGTLCEVQKAAAVQTVRHAALKSTCTSFGRVCVFQRDCTSAPPRPINTVSPKLNKAMPARMKAKFVEIVVLKREECAAAISTALANVSLPNDRDFLRRWPSQLSVGQAQRVIIAMAILHRPSLLIADEPTSALDTITQSEILLLFAKLNRELRTGILYISHDLLSVAALCHRIAILNAGEIVECGPPSQIFGAPQHSYTQRLVAALPRVPVYTSMRSELRNSV